MYFNLPVNVYISTICNEYGDLALASGSRSLSTYRDTLENSPADDTTASQCSVVDRNVNKRIQSSKRLDYFITQ